MNAHKHLTQLRWIVLAACIVLSAYLLHTIFELEISFDLHSSQPSLRVLQPQIERPRTKHDPEKWLAEHSNLNHHETASSWFNDRPKAALISLVRNEELDGILQSMRQLERHWNRRYNYPWIFFSEKPFTDEFKVSSKSPLRTPQ